MSREVKVGLLAFVSILISIWGYRFLKGKNLFSSTNSFYTTFEDVTKLPNSAAVYLNGYKVGQVTSIKLNTQDVKKMDVFFSVDGDIPFPKDGKVIMKNDGILGDKILALDFKSSCEGANCASSGDYVENVSVGLIGSVLDSEEASEYVSEVSRDLQAVLGSLGDEKNPGKINDIVRNLDVTVAEIATLTHATTQLIQTSQANISKTLRHFEKISQNIAESNDEISSILQNVYSLSSSLSNGSIDSTISNTNTMVVTANDALLDIQKTSASLSGSINQLNNILSDMNSGKGTLGQLLQDKSLYENINSTSKNLDLLLQDLRLNPKRYLNVSVFGKKTTPYTLPEDDPAQKGQ